MNIQNPFHENKIFLNKHFYGSIENMSDSENSLQKDLKKEVSFNVENSLRNSSSKVDLNNLIKRVKEEEKRSKRQNIVISAAALSAVAVFGIILTL